MEKTLTGSRSVDSTPIYEKLEEVADAVGGVVRTQFFVGSVDWRTLTLRVSLSIADYY